jgi:hypothetical protein
MKLMSLRDLYVAQLKDLYSAENQLLKALPKMAKMNQVGIAAPGAPAPHFMVTVILRLDSELPTTTLVRNSDSCQ